MTKTAILLAALALACATPIAHARHHRPAAPSAPCVETDAMRPICGMAQMASPRLQGGHGEGFPRPATYHGSRILAHPQGCPARLFCGCGASVHVFGRSIRSLWLAANWFRFPRARPAPGMVAVRQHHVFVLEAELGRGLWRVYDANAGHHLTLIHARSIAGYTIVDPHGGA